MKYRHLSALLPVALFAACANVPLPSTATPEQLKAMSDIELCDSYYHTKAPAVQAELEARKFITEDEWVAVKDERVKIRMNEAAVHCAWGAPNEVKQMITVYGESKQLIYRAVYGKSAYVTLNRGHVIMAH